MSQQEYLFSHQDLKKICISIITDISKTISQTSYWQALTEHTSDSYRNAEICVEKSEKNQNKKSLLRPTQERAEYTLIKQVFFSVHRLMNKSVSFLYYPFVHVTTCMKKKKKEIGIFWR